MKSFSLSVKDFTPALLQFLLPLCFALTISACDNIKSGDNATGESDDNPRQSSGISGKQTNITLFVDTDAIDNNTPIDSLIRIKDDAGSAHGGRVKEHTTEIKRGQVILWKVKPEPRNRNKVEITNITNKKDGSLKLIDKIEYNQNESLVKAWTKNTYDSAVDEYNIHFKVENMDTIFVIDPILRMVR